MVMIIVGSICIIVGAIVESIDAGDIGEKTKGPVGLVGTIIKLIGIVLMFIIGVQLFDWLFGILFGIASIIIGQLIGFIIFGFIRN